MRPHTPPNVGDFFRFSWGVQALGYTGIAFIIAPWTRTWFTQIYLVLPNCIAQVMQRTRIELINQCLPRGQSCHHTSQPTMPSKCHNSNATLTKQKTLALLLTCQMAHSVSQDLCHINIARQKGYAITSTFAPGQRLETQHATSLQGMCHVTFANQS